LKPSPPLQPGPAPAAGPEDRFLRTAGIGRLAGRSTPIQCSPQPGMKTTLMSAGGQYHEPDPEHSSIAVVNRFAVRKSLSRKTFGLSPLRKARPARFSTVPRFTRARSDLRSDVKPGSASSQGPNARHPQPPPADITPPPARPHRMPTPDNSRPVTASPPHPADSPP